MKLNSTAVMQRRHEAKESVDDFPTPPWATRALCEFLQGRGLIGNKSTVREPAANRGYMVRSLEEFFPCVLPSDLMDYGKGYPVRDFLKDDFNKTNWLITNPPFVLGQEFIQKGLEVADNVAVILRIAFLEGKKRYENLFKHNRPNYVLQFVERVPMVKGRYDPAASSATAYAWFVWTQEPEHRTELVWIPPCKNRLIRPEKDFKE